MAAALVVLTSLGMWQVRRLAWKEAMLARVEEGLKQPPVSIAKIEKIRQQGGDIEYRPAFAEGEFQHEGEQHYFATHKSQVGYFIYTPLRLASGANLFVNRGFVPIDLKDPKTRPAGQIEGRVRINGLARTAPLEKPNTLVPNNDLAKNVYYWKSLSQMAGNAYDKTENQTVNFFLDAGEGNAPGGWPQGGVTRVTFPNNHLQYAFTWFGLALTLLCVGGYFLFGLLRAKEDD